MSNIKALDKLRELCADVKSMDFASVGCDAVLEIADDIEQEIVERYIELPVDADGVPIHPGNRVEMDGKGGEVWLVGTTDVMCNDGMSYRAVAVNHVKPRTIEDAIADALRDYAITDMSRDEVIAKYAEEIRGMMA